MKAKYLIPVLLFSVLLGGCSRPIQENCGCLPTTTRKEGEFRLNVDRVGSDICPDAPNEGYYKPGAKFSFRIKSVTDCTFYPYLDEVRLTATKGTSTLGEYSHYEFEMPDRDCLLTITSNPFFYDRDYALYELNPFIGSINPSDIKQVRIEEGDLGNGSQTSNSTVTYSEDREDIEFNVSIMMNPYMVKTDTAVHTNRYVRTTFIYNNDVAAAITIENDSYIYRSFSNFQRFTFKEDAPRFKIKHPMTGDNR